MKQKPKKLNFYMKNSKGAKGEKYLRVRRSERVRGNLRLAEVVAGMVR